MNKGTVVSISDHNDLTSFGYLQLLPCDCLKPIICDKRLITYLHILCALLVLCMLCQYCVALVWLDRKSNS